jgi:hypothetical protein
VSRLVSQALSQDIGTPQQWRAEFDYLIPPLMVRLSAWPQGRGLRIESLDGDLLLDSGRMDPAPVRVYRQGGDYCVVDLGLAASTGGGGDSFFRALLISMRRAQATLTDSVGSDRSESAVIAALRDQLAQYMLHHPQEVGELLLQEGAMQT